MQPDWNLRGVFTADEDGAYWFRSVKPRYYPIPYDGPVGKMLERSAAIRTAPRTSTSS